MIRASCHANLYGRRSITSSHACMLPLILLLWYSLFFSTVCTKYLYYIMSFETWELIIISRAHIILTSFILHTRSCAVLWYGLLHHPHHHPAWRCHLVHWVHMLEGDRIAAQPTQRAAQLRGPANKCLGQQVGDKRGKFWAKPLCAESQGGI